MESGSTVYLITRHPGAKQWAEEEGVQVDVQVDHLDVETIRPGDIVIGSLPVNLAAAVCDRGAKYFHLSLNLPMEWRGRELHSEDMRRFGASLEQYSVRKTS
jgi:CRISPR-associated protein Csx16